jgi:hypothetical protein
MGHSHSIVGDVVDAAVKGRTAAGSALVDSTDPGRRGIG